MIIYFPLLTPTEALLPAPTFGTFALIIAVSLVVSPRPAATFRREFPTWAVFGLTARGTTILGRAFQRQGLRTRLAELTGAREVQIGDPAFGAR